MYIFKTWNIFSNKSTNYIWTLIKTGFILVNEIFKQVVLNKLIDIYINRFNPINWNKLYMHAQLNYYVV